MMRDFHDYAATAPAVFRQNHLRLIPLEPKHADQIAQLVNHCSDESRFLRFHTGLATLRPCMAAQLAAADGAHTVALGLWDGRRHLVADARYTLLQDGVAEVAVLVNDAFQGRGLGTALLAILFQHATDADVLALHAEVLPHNQGILHTLRRLAPVHHVGLDEGVKHLCLPLTDAPCPAHPMAEVA